MSDSPCATTKTRAVADENPFNTTAELIHALRAGQLIVLLDDEDRENEGDLVMAACHATAKKINFMARYGRGLICMPMSQQRCEQLHLPLMIRDNTANLKTNFTVSIESARGVTTGISAADRATTVLAAAQPYATAKDIVSPGHIFPLQARPGGVFTRRGHTEAVVDLVQLAGLGDSGVLVEILNEDGTMARKPELLAFARQHQLKIGTIDDLVIFRQSLA